MINKLNVFINFCGPIAAFAFELPFHSAALCRVRWFPAEGRNSSEPERVSTGACGSRRAWHRGMLLAWGTGHSRAGSTDPRPSRDRLPQSRLGGSGPGIAPMETAGTQRRTGRAGRRCGPSQPRSLRARRSSRALVVALAALPGLELRVAVPWVCSAAPQGAREPPRRWKELSASSSHLCAP